MLICKLIDSIWATRKYEELVEVIDGPESGCRLVCVDTISAGTGDRVLVATGSAAYHFMRETFGKNAPVDAAIVGIIDEDVSL